MNFNTTRGQVIVIFLNAFIRFAQLVAGVVTICLYSTQTGYWLNHGIGGRIRFEFAVGSLAIITALALGAIPLFLSYRPVAFAAPWDLTMFILYSIALGLMRAIFSAPYNLKDNVKVMDPKDPVFGYHWTDMMNYFWVDLAGMLLFLVSAIMGAALLFIGRTSSRKAII